MEIVIPTLFGLESAVKDELAALGIGPERIRVTDGRADVAADPGDFAALAARCNLWLRTAERVLLKIGGGRAQTFDELFGLASGLPWEDFVPAGWAFHVNGHSIRSKLFGIPACQSIVKKAIVLRLSAVRKIAPGSLLPEDERRGLLRISFSIVADEVSFLIDTSGEGLHKRGYRPLTHTAPLKETLAAGLVLLSRWDPDSGEAFADPLCGTGTIPIEAALIATRTAPGIRREFSAERWPLIGKKTFDTAREEALDVIRAFPGRRPFIFGSDIEGKYTAVAADHAAQAGVAAITSFSRMDAAGLTRDTVARLTGSPRTLIVTNPPYGERMLDAAQAAALYRTLGSLWLDGGRVAEGLRLSILAPKDGFEAGFGAVADKRRKLYNGMIPCNMYHYFRSRRRSS